MEKARAKARKLARISCTVPRFRRLFSAHRGGGAAGVPSGLPDPGGVFRKERTGKGTVTPGGSWGGWQRRGICLDMNFEKLISFLRKKKQKNYKKIELYIRGGKNGGLFSLERNYFAAYEPEGGGKLMRRERDFSRRETTGRKTRRLPSRMAADTLRGSRGQSLPCTHFPKGKYSVLDFASEDPPGSSGETQKRRARK